MPAQPRLRPHETALIMLHAHRSLRPVHAIGPVLGEHGLVLQVGFLDDDGGGGLGLEAELAVPGHVLDGEEGAVGDDDHVEVAVGDEDAVRGLDDLGEDGLDGVGGEVAFAFGAAGVVAVYLLAADEDGLGGAFGPGDGGGGVDGGFDVGAVEVGGWGVVGAVDELRGEGEHVPEEGALLVDFVNVEARVVGQGGVVDHVEDVAGGLAGVVEVDGGLVAGGGEGEVFFAVVGVAAGFVERFELGEEGVVELEHGLVFQHVGYGGGFFRRVVELADARVIDESSWTWGVRCREHVNGRAWGLTGKVIVLLVLFIQHCRRNVWNVSTRITFAGHVNFVILDSKGLFKILEEFDKVLGSLLLGLGRDFANREARTDGLLHPRSRVSYYPNALFSIMAKNTIACLSDLPTS